MTMAHEVQRLGQPWSYLTQVLVPQHLTSTEVWDRVSEGQSKAVSMVPRPKGAILKQQIVIKGAGKKC